jgi:hypothetical protein
MGPRLAAFGQLLDRIGSPDGDSRLFSAAALFLTFALHRGERRLGTRRPCDGCPGFRARDSGRAMAEQGRAVVWESHHENGWTTVVAQHHGSFVGYTVDRSVVQLAYTGDRFEDACAAVLASLARATGHAQCSTGCSEWVMRLSRPSEAKPAL